MEAAFKDLLAIILVLPLVSCFQSSQHRASGEYSGRPLLPWRWQTQRPALRWLSHAVGPGEALCGSGVACLGSDTLGSANCAKCRQTGEFTGHILLKFLLRMSQLSFLCVPREEMQLFFKVYLYGHFLMRLVLLRRHRGPFLRDIWTHCSAAPRQ